MKICIVGGGPAGLAAAIFAARRGAETILLEKNPHCGAKLLTTGGGRCNVTNLRPAGEWPALFGRHGRFITPALSFLPREALCDWLAELGQPLASPDGFHLFPTANSAKAVRDALLAAATQAGVSVRTGTKAQKLLTNHDRTAVRGIAVPDEEIACDRVILACGGKSWPATGSTWDGCRMAETVGHTVKPPFPGLVGLRAANLDPDLAGLVLPNALASFKSKGNRALEGAGELLFTHNGLSGPAILDISAAICQALATQDDSSDSITLHIRWHQHLGMKEWLNIFAVWRRSQGALPMDKLLREHFSQRFARWLCQTVGLDANASAATLAAAQRDALARALSAFPVRITGSEGWDRAMVTRGGVDLRQVAPDTLESRLLHSLHFAGETLDIDGPCGGYNLHWAFASGALAGTNAAKA